MSVRCDRSHTHTHTHTLSLSLSLSLSLLSIISLSLSISLKIPTQQFKHLLYFNGIPVALCVYSAETRIPRKALPALAHQQQQQAQQQKEQQSSSTSAPGSREHFIAHTTTLPPGVRGDILYMCHLLFSVCLFKPSCAFGFQSLFGFLSFI